MAQAEIKTWSGVTRFNVYPYNSNIAPFPASSQALVQHFTVPEGTIGTKFEFFCVRGAYDYSEVSAVVQIYEVSPNARYIGAGTKTLDLFSGTSDWVAVEGLNLEPGTYYAQLYPTLAQYVWDYFGSEYYPDSTYAEGYAAYGWSGGTAVAGDFKCRLTVSPDVASAPDEPSPAVIETWAGWDRFNVCTYNANAAPFPTNPQVLVQTFAVPEGTVGTKFEFYCVNGSDTLTNVNAILQVYRLFPDALYIGAVVRPFSDFVGSENWMVMDNLNLEPGYYYAQLYPSDNGASTWSSFGSVYYPESTYSGGTAAYGWSGGTAVAGDFKCRLTVTPGLLKAAAPGFSPDTMYISSPTAITISSATSGAEIYYTTDGTTPTATSIQHYTGPVTISAGTTLKAFAVADGYINSDVTGERFMAPTIPIVAWIGIQPGLSSPDRYKELRDAGFTHNLHQDYSSWSAVETELNLAKEAGIKMFVEPYYFTKALATFVNQFKNHPALEAYYLMDEPETGEFAELAAKSQAVEAIDSSHWCYANLLPNVAVADYEGYVDSFISTVDPKVLSFDHYPIVSGASGASDAFYQNLAVISSKTKTAGIPFWAFVLTTAHNGYPTPTLGHLRFQAYTNLAYGAQGLQYFTYWARWDLVNTLIDVNGEETEVYDLVKTFNQEIKGLSPVFLGAKMLSVGYTGDTIPSETTRYTPSSPITALTTVGTGALVSRLENGDTEYLAVVNRDYTNTMTLNITVGSSPSVSRVFKNGTTSSVTGTVQYTVDAGDIVILSWSKKVLLPGDANGDGAVNVSDLSLLAANYGVTNNATWAMGDFTGDGAVNVSDLSLLAANYGSGSKSTLSWADAYAQAFGTTNDVDETSDESEGADSTACSSLGLSLIAGLTLMGLMIIKLDD
jgi:hypothetical protein